MLLNMTRLANQLFKDKHKDNIVVGFHVPPFTSINHLHLHLIEKPFLSFWRYCLLSRWAKYPPWSFAKWFITIDQLVSKLEKS